MQLLSLKLTKNVLLSLILATSLSGCASLPSFSFGKNDVKEVEVKKVAEERARLNLSSPEPLDLKAPKWIIITPENSNEVWPLVKEENEDVVLFGLTDQGYETLSIMIAELRNFINTQRLIIEQYKNYYEPQKIEPKQQ